MLKPSLNAFQSQDHNTFANAAIFKKQLDEVLLLHANLTDACEANKALVAEYKEKNETLTSLLGEYKECKNMFDTVTQRLEEERSSRQAAELIVSESSKEITQLKSSVC